MRLESILRRRMHVNRSIDAKLTSEGIGIKSLDGLL